MGPKAIRTPRSALILGFRSNFLRHYESVSGFGCKIISELGSGSGSDENCIKERKNSWWWERNNGTSGHGRKFALEIWVIMWTIERNALKNL